MLDNYFGEMAALITAMCWAVTGIAFESAGKKVGSLTVNLIRLIIAIFILSAYTYISRGKLFPTDASLHNWMWLALSGLVGFVIGDLCLFQAIVLIGARISSVIMSLAPPIAAFAGWLIMGEVFTPMNFVGMTLTLTGIILVILKRDKNIDRISVPNANKKRKLNINRFFFRPFSGCIIFIIGCKIYNYRDSLNINEHYAGNYYHSGCPVFS